MFKSNKNKIYLLKKKLHTKNLIKKINKNLTIFMFAMCIECCLSDNAEFLPYVGCKSVTYEVAFQLECRQLNGVLEQLLVLDRDE